MSNASIEAGAARDETKPSPEALRNLGFGLLVVAGLFAGYYAVVVAPTRPASEATNVAATIAPQASLTPTVLTEDEVPSISGDGLFTRRTAYDCMFDAKVDRGDDFSRRVRLWRCMKQTFDYPRAYDVLVANGYPLDSEVRHALSRYVVDPRGEAVLHAYIMGFTNAAAATPPSADIGSGMQNAAPAPSRRAPKAGKHGQVVGGTSR